MDEMHRTGENPHLVKYFGSLLKCYDSQSNSYNGTCGWFSKDRQLTKIYKKISLSIIIDCLANCVSS